MFEVKTLDENLKGIDYNKENGSWSVFIKQRNKNLFVGEFKHPSQARTAYCKATSLFGDGLLPIEEEIQEYVLFDLQKNDDVKKKIEFLSNLRKKSKDRALESLKEDLRKLKNIFRIYDLSIEKVSKESGISSVSMYKLLKKTDSVFKKTTIKSLEVYVDNFGHDVYDNTKTKREVLSEMLCAYMYKTGFSITEISRKIGMPRPSIYELLKKERSFQCQNAMKLYKFLKKEL